MLRVQVDLMTYGVQASLVACLLEIKITIQVCRVNFLVTPAKI